MGGGALKLFPDNAVQQEKGKKLGEEDLKRA
jgi:hypothetical protein